MEGIRLGIKISAGYYTAMPAIPARRVSGVYPSRSLEGGNSTKRAGLDMTYMRLLGIKSKVSRKNFPLPKNSSPVILLKRIYHAARNFDLFVLTTT